MERSCIQLQLLLYSQFTSRESTLSGADGQFSCSDSCQLDLFLNSNWELCFITLAVFVMRTICGWNWKENKTKLFQKMVTGSTSLTAVLHWSASRPLYDFKCICYWLSAFHRIYLTTKATDKKQSTFAILTSMTRKVSDLSLKVRPQLYNSFIAAILSSLKTAGITLPPGTQCCDQVLQMQHLLPHAAAKAIVLGCNIFHLIKLLASSLSSRPMSELAFPVTFPIKSPRYVSEDSGCHSSSHQWENTLDYITTASPLNRQVKQVLGDFGTAFSWKRTNATAINSSEALLFIIWECDHITAWVGVSAHSLCTTSQTSAYKDPYPPSLTRKGSFETAF